MLFYLYILFSLPFTRRRGVVTTRRYFPVLENRGKITRAIYKRRLKIEAYWAATFGPSVTGRHDESGRHSRLDLVGYCLRFLYVPITGKVAIMAIMGILFMGTFVEDKVRPIGHRMCHTDEVYNFIRYGSNDPSIIREVEKRWIQEGPTVASEVRALAADAARAMLP